MHSSFGNCCRVSYWFPKLLALVCLFGRDGRVSQPSCLSGQRSLGSLGRQACCYRVGFNGWSDGVWEKMFLMYSLAKLSRSCHQHSRRMPGLGNLSTDLILLLEGPDILSLLGLAVLLLLLGIQYFVFLFSIFQRGRELCLWDPAFSFSAEGKQWGWSNGSGGTWSLLLSALHVWPGAIDFWLRPHGCFIVGHCSLVSTSNPQFLYLSSIMN